MNKMMLVTDLPEIDYNSREDRAILKGKLMDVDFQIWYYGDGYPCAYIRIDKPLPDDIEDCAPCHGGITFSSKLNGKVKGRWGKGFWIGWDYAHNGDYLRALNNYRDKKWTTEELLDDCMGMIVWCKEKGLL